MNTYTALVAAQVGNTRKLVRTEVKAVSAAEAKWLLQAIYGFHAVISTPAEMQLENEIVEEASSKTADQIRIDNLNAAKDRANSALKAERDRQSRQRAMRALTKPTLKPTSTIN